MERAMTRTIDSHQHFWRSAAQAQPWRTEAHGALERDFEPDDLLPELDAAGIDATVVMQSVDEPAENTRLARYAEWDRVAGVVAWVPLRDSREAGAELARLSIPKLCGVRSLISTDPLEWLNEPDSLAFFRDVADRGLAWDVVPITEAQTRQVIALSHLIPELRIVVDHLGRPPIDSGGWEPWAGNMRELASSPGVAVKVSIGIDVLTAWSAWDGDTLERYIAYISEYYGARRLMLASNWPVVLLRATYADAWHDLRAMSFAQFPDESDRTELAGGTAERWYRLSS
jgi:L-fuconolactonase